MDLPMNHYFLQLQHPLLLHMDKKDLFHHYFLEEDLQVVYFLNQQKDNKKHLYLHLNHQE